MQTLPPSDPSEPGASDAEVRAALLRALTELYLQKPTHTRQEEQHYTELASRLLDEVDASMRLWVALRLASYPAAPEAVVQRLASYAAETDTPILRDAARLMRSEAATPPRPENPPGEAPTVPWAVELNELFFAANSAERRLILLNLAYGAPEATAPLNSSSAQEVNRQLEAAALAHNQDAFIRGLERSLALSPAQAYRIVHDPLGEPLVVAAKALGMESDVLQRILLFINPAIGRSVPRIYVLATLYDELEDQAAQELVAIWRAAEPQSKRAAARQTPEDETRSDRHRPARTASEQPRVTGTPALRRPSGTEG